MMETLTCSMWARSSGQAGASQNQEKKKAEPKADKEGEMATSRRDIYSRCVFTIFSSNSFWSFSALDFSKRRFRSSCRIRACSSLVWVYGKIDRKKEKKKNEKRKREKKREKGETHKTGHKVEEEEEESFDFMKRYPFTKLKERKQVKGGRRIQRTDVKWLAKVFTPLYFLFFVITSKKTLF